MFETIVSNVIVPAAILGLVVAALRRVLRADAHHRQQPSDPLLDWIRTAAILGGFGPFWYSADLARRVDAAAEPPTRDGDVR